GVIPGIVRDYMSPVLGVFVFVGICSAIMSTMDSLINTGAMVLTKDVYSLYINKKANDKQLIRMSMLSTATVTCIGLVIALRIRSILDVSWIAADLLSTGCFVPLVLGFLWKRGTAAGALSSIIAGSSFSVYNLLAQFGLHLPVAWEPNSAKQVMIGMGLALVVYVIVSLLTRSDEQTTKANVFIAKARNKYTDF
ncbi:MAG: sodium:solute symporter family transporter, partial [Tannerellaceae bacterium]